MSYFSATYAEARAKFLAAADAAGAQVHGYRHPLPGPDGGPLYLDVAQLHPGPADRLLVLVSGTHGIEGYTGSACQTAMLREALYTEAVPGTAFLLVHALNPYGFAHQTRVNEDNVDLNRNFIDHSAPPSNPDYELVHDALVPGDWRGPSWQRGDEFLGRFMAEAGIRRLQEVITRGQHTRPGGLFYGGSRQVWSNQRWREIIGRFSTGYSSVAYIDLHTGLGIRAEGEPIFRGGRDRGAVARAGRWYGAALTTSEAGTSSSTPIIGNTASALAEELDPDTILTAITLEFGTVPGAVVLDSLRADNWLRLQTEPGPTEAATIKAAIREAFYPADPQWRQAVWTRAQEVFRLAFAGLAER